jgi:hypothetical protein
MIPEKDRITACDNEACDFTPCLEKRKDQAEAALKAAAGLENQAKAFRIFADAAKAFRAAQASDDAERASFLVGA